MQFAFCVLPKVLSMWFIFVLFPKCFSITLLSSLITTNISWSTAWGRLSISTKSCSAKKYNGQSCHPLFSWLTAVKAVHVLMCASGAGRKWESCGEQRQGWEMSGRRERGERTGSGWAKLCREWPRDFQGIREEVLAVRVTRRPAERGSGTSGTAAGFCSIPGDWSYWQHLNSKFFIKIEVLALDVAETNWKH